MDSVAGVQTPAFVERRSSGPGHRRTRFVSPEFRLRPSLSEYSGACDSRAARRVSPEFRLRPSLSDRARAQPRGHLYPVSPEFRLRPSLSARPAPARPAAPARVAGVQTPAFVERRSFRCPPQRTSSRVAGVQTPAFVERCRQDDVARGALAVSPEFRLRPSLSAPHGLRPPAHRRQCRRSSDSGPSLSAFRVAIELVLSGRVAGVQTPAFVERFYAHAECNHPLIGVAGVQTPAFVERLASICHPWAWAKRCRRSSDSGLR